MDSRSGQADEHESRVVSLSSFTAWGSAASTVAPDSEKERVKPYYQDAAVTLYHGDCRDVLPALLPSVDLGNNAGTDFLGRAVVTDPPYNARKNYGKTTNDAMPWPEWCAWFDGVLDVCKMSAPNVFAFLSQTTAKHYERLGAHPRDWCLIWNKPLSLSVCEMPFMPHWEPIFYWGGQKRTKDGGAFWGSDVLTCNVEIGTDRWGHPTPKPLLLMLDLVSRIDGVIVDPFSGSGTTPAACKQLGRQCIAVEISEEFCESQARRLECTSLGVRASAGQGALDLFGEQTA